MRRRPPLAAFAVIVAATLLSVAAAPARADGGPGTRWRPHAVDSGKSRGEKALAFALAQIGKPYAYGGNGPDAYDCSGLTQQAWRDAGVRIPRTSQEQAGVGISVPLGQARLGDLVVFYSDASHVGIYAGHGMVVVAPHSGAFIRLEAIVWMPVYAVRRPG
ncbi:MAG TPA: C40 family peptidase [Actinospica sp.]|nr:C40 family peptidase [Actinospica sp.]